MARMCGAIDAPLTAENLKDCDLVLVAIRPAAAVKWVKEHAEGIRRDAILVDLCGVKRAVVRELAPVAEQYGFAYIGGHPMAGRERGGFTSATDSLYVGASMILTPDKRTDMQLLETLKAFFLDIGFASLTFSDPEEHDRIIAFTSQLAHIVSSAYVKSPEAQKRRGFSAGSFQDMTRVARLDEDMDGAVSGRRGLSDGRAGYPHRTFAGVCRRAEKQGRRAPARTAARWPREEGHCGRQLKINEDRRGGKTYVLCSDH